MHIATTAAAMAIRTSVAPTPGRISNDPIPRCASSAAGTTAAAAEGRADPAAAARRRRRGAVGRHAANGQQTREHSLTGHVAVRAAISARCHCRRRRRRSNILRATYFLSVLTAKISRPDVCKLITLCSKHTETKWVRIHG